MTERPRCVVVGDAPSAAGRSLADGLPHATWTALGEATAEQLAIADALVVWAP